MDRLTARIAVASIFLLAPLAGSPQQDPKDGPAESLRRKTEKHKKDVVRIRGLSFKKEVAVEVYSKKELRDFLKRELAEELPPEKAGKWQRAYAKFGLIPKDMDLIEASLVLFGGSIAGFYHPRTKELRLIIPDAKDKAAAEELKKKMGIDLEAVTMIHELTHAAQDQKFELSTLPLDDETNDDLVLALKSVIEGDASAVGWKYGFKGLFKFMIPEYNALYKKGELDGKANELPLYLRQTLTFPYGYGTDFVLAYMKAVKGTFKDTDPLFRDFPLSTEQIMHPEKYHDRNKRDNPMLVTLEGLDAVVGAPWERTVDNVHGEFCTRILLGEFLRGTPDERRIRTGSEGWDGDRYVLFENGPDKVLYVWYSTWDSDRDAREFYEAYAVALEEKYGVESPEGRRKERTSFDSRGGHVLLERKGRDVLVLDGATPEILERAGRIWKTAAKSELNKVVRKNYFVCSACDFRKAFSGPCPTCGKELRFDDGRKKKRREY